MWRSLGRRYSQLRRYPPRRWILATATRSNWNGGTGTYGHAFGGGEFKVSGVSILNGPGDSFLTFCLEYSEHISLGASYYVDINTAAKSGGGGAVTDPSGGFYDPLNASTAWLYTQFRSNTLSGFDYASDASANSLQLAIWKLEGELSGAALTTYSSALWPKAGSRCAKFRLDHPRQRNGLEPIQFV